MGILLLLMVVFQGEIMAEAECVSFLPAAGDLSALRVVTSRSKQGSRFVTPTGNSELSASNTLSRLA